MLSYGLKSKFECTDLAPKLLANGLLFSAVHNDEDLEESKQILEQLKRQEYEDRVARAREEYERGGGIDQ